MLRLEGAVHESTLEPLLLELVKMRASQMNGCAYCLDMHSKDALALGEDGQRLHLLALAIVAINGWNRLAVGLRSPVGDYVSPHQ